MDNNAFKQKLEDEKALLEEELKSVGKKNPQNPADWQATETQNLETADLNTKADVEEDLEERHALTDTLESRLSSVNHALEKISQGSYGMCDTCNKKIERARLDADAAATTCKEHMNE